MNISIDTQHIYDVIIIGAGPVGLAIANGLYQRGIDNLLVLDKTREFRQAGQTIGLLPNGLKALKFINLEAYNEVIRVGKTDSNDWIYKSINGETLRSLPQSYNYFLQKYGEGKIFINWYDIQTCLRKFLPSEKVLVNHYCTNISEEKNNYLKIETESNSEYKKNPYAHWNISSVEQEKTSEQKLKKFFYSRLVIGADGINSQVRKSLYANEQNYENYSSPEYSGFTGISGFNKNKLSQNSLKEIKETFLETAALLTVRKNIPVKNSKPITEPRMFIAPMKDNRFFYVIQGAFEKELILKEDKNHLLNLAKNTLINCNFPDCFIELIDRTDLEDIGKRLYYMHRAIISRELLLPNTKESLEEMQEGNKVIPPWFGGRIVLSGDAAHGMPPFSGQGTNQGLEDAAILSKLISEIKDKLTESNIIKSAFNRYDSLRRPTLIKIQQATLGPYSYYSDEQLNKYHEDILSKNEM